MLTGQELKYEPHPHLVLLEFDKECLVVPCFTAGGHDVEERLALLEKMSYPRDVVRVELDNAKHVSWMPGRSGHHGCWCHPSHHSFMY